MTEVTTLQLDARLQGGDQAIAQLNRLKTEGNGAGASFGNLAMRIAGLTTGFGLAVQAGQATIRMVKDLAVESITLAASFEKSRMTWGVLVGDMDRGSAVFDKLYAFAARTPMSFQGINQAATTLKGFGVTVENLIPTMGRLGDIAMGDDAKLQRIALVYGQTIAKGKADTRDLWQFVDAGVPIVDLLAKTMGKTAGEILDLTAQGKVGFTDLNAAIEAATNAGGAFYQMMDKTAQTTSGKWSTLKDNWKAVLADIGTTTLPWLNQAIDEVNASLEDAINKASRLKFIQTGKGDSESVLSGIDAEIARRQATLAANQGKFAGGLNFNLFHSSTVQKWDPFGTGEKVEGQVWTPVYSEVEEQQAAIARLQAQRAEIVALAAKNKDAANEKAREKNRASTRIGYTIPTDTGTGSTAPAVMYPDESAIWSRASGIAGLARGEGAPEAPVVPQTFAGNAPYKTAYPSDPMYHFTDSDAKAAKDYADAVAKIGTAFSGAAKDAYVNSFKALGEAFAKGGDGAAAMGDAMRDTASALLNMMPQLLLEVGLKACLNNNWILGLSLIALSGLVAIGAGAANASGSESTSTASDLAAEARKLTSYYQAAEKFNSEGRTTGALHGYAMGGVPFEPGFSAYKNSVVNTPHYFGFASGGVFGEAGYEAAVPLVRTRSGNLGVETSGAASISVVINNHTSAEVSATPGVDQNGKAALIVSVIDKTVKSGLASGKYASALAAGSAKGSGVRVAT